MGYFSSSTKKPCLLVRKDIFVLRMHQIFLKVNTISYDNFPETNSKLVPENGWL